MFHSLFLYICDSIYSCSVIVQLYWKWPWDAAFHLTCFMQENFLHHVFLADLHNHYCKCYQVSTSVPWRSLCHVLLSNSAKDDEQDATQLAKTHNILCVSYSYSASSAFMWLCEVLFSAHCDYFPRSFYTMLLAPISIYLWGDSNFTHDHWYLSLHISLFSCSARNNIPRHNS